jgi:anti-sigma regulatory factor (Ser/Thr protein kinase)
VDVQARYDPRQFKITVTVSDRGTWRRPVSPRTLSRGRGIPLMHALSDHASIDTTDRGTNVRMEWTNVDHRAAG